MHTKIDPSGLQDLVRRLSTPAEKPVLIRTTVNPNIVMFALLPDEETPDFSQLGMTLIAIFSDGYRRPRLEELMGLYVIEQPTPEEMEPVRRLINDLLEEKERRDAERHA
jgi:hypothetical protein